MKIKIIGILVCTLLIATAALPVVSTMNVDSTNRLENENTCCEGVPYSTLTQPTTTINPVLKWAWDGTGAGEPDYNRVLMTPLVCCFPFSQPPLPLTVPVIVFTTYTGNNYLTDGILRAVYGENGTSRFDVKLSQLRVSPISTPAIGNVMFEFPGPEIVALADTYDRLYCFSNSGVFIWTSEITNPMTISAPPCIADLDHDGNPEVICEDKVFRGETGVLLAEGVGGQHGTGRGISCVADVDLVDGPNIICGNTIYDYITPTSPPEPLVVKYENLSLQDGFTAIGNFDNDSEAEIVLVSPGSQPGDLVELFLLNHNLEAIDNLTIPEFSRYYGGPPTIEDFNGDGFPDIGIAGYNSYNVYSYSQAGGLYLLWTHPISDISSAKCGSTVFDLNGDKVKDVIYSDENFLYIFNGTTGDEQWSIACPSITAREMPIVADVDRDCHAEIVVGCNPGYTSGDTGIRVYENDANWINARNIWNQYSYHITNIYGNGEVPINEVNNWIAPWLGLRILNNYRIQFNPPGFYPVSPDIIGDIYGLVEIEYEYSFVSTDPDGDDVYYYIDWGDGNIEETAFYPSGEEVIRTHAWSEEGTYTIGALAIDIYELWSDWGTLSVTMPVSYQISQQSTSPLFFQILERILQNLR